MWGSSLPLQAVVGLGKVPATMYLTLAKETEAQFIQLVSCLSYDGKSDLADS